MIALTEAQLSAWYGMLFWPLVRVLAVISTAPLLSHRAVPLRAKVALGVAIALVLAPGVETPPLGNVLGGEGLALLGANILVGALIGFSVRLVFAAVELAGEVIGLQMGLSYAAFFNPASGQQQNPVSTFFSLVATLLFVAIDGHLMVLQALADSFRVVPLVATAPLPFDALAIARLGAETFALGVALSLPFLAVMLLTNVVLGVLARVAPQLNVFAVGFPLTLGVGLLALFMLLPYLEPPLRAALERAAVEWLR
jgi:flagellar biosynthetic protein FliR